MKKKEGVRDFGKTFFLVFIFYLFFVVVVINQNGSFFWRIADTFFRYRKILQKRNFRQISFDIRQFQLVGVSRALRNWRQLGSNIHDIYSIVFNEKCTLTIKILLRCG